MLSHWLAVCVGSSSAEITLGRQVARTKAHLAIEKARFGEQLNVNGRSHKTWRLRRFRHSQPLVENAMRHGIAPQANGGRLTIGASRDETRCESA
jgi:LytS/YehU family sensor histidine kinase